MAKAVETADHDGKTGIGPPATQLLLDNDAVRVWQMHVGPGQQFWPHYHNYDYVLFYLTDVLATAENGGEDFEDTWQERYDYAGKATGLRGVMTRARSLFFIPGTGFLSPGFRNIGDTPFVAPLVEIKRRRPGDSPSAGYARTDALVGSAVGPGCTHLLENDRVRIYETMLAPGQSDELRPRLDTAVYVIAGGRLGLEEVDDRGEKTSFEVDRDTDQGYWMEAKTARRLVNTGATNYRELSVELK